MSDIYFKEFINENLCKSCGGKCCALYSQDIFHPFSFNLYFEDYVVQCHDREGGIGEDWKIEAHKKYGVYPLFDPLETHMSGNEYMITELSDKGINHQNCEFLGKDGCMIERKYRPERCRSFKCEIWVDAIREKINA